MTRPSGMGGLRSVFDVIATGAVLCAAVVVIVVYMRNGKGQEDQDDGAVRIDAVTIETKKSPRLGSEFAHVGIVMFSDFEWRFCQTFSAKVLPVLKQAFLDSGKVQLSYKHFPLDSIHPSARRAGEIAACAAPHGKFWPAHDILLEPGALTSGVNPAYMALRLSLDEHQLATCAETEGAAIVSSDVRQGTSLGVSGTPAFFLGPIDRGVMTATRRIDGIKDASVFHRAIDELLSER